MSCHVNTEEYQLHLYENFPEDAPDCWSNLNIYAIAANDSGQFDPQAPSVSEAVTNFDYYLVANVKNRGGNTRILDMQFGIPSFMLVNGTQQKTVDFHAPARIAGGSLVKVRSAYPVQFIHPGNYEVDVQIKNWHNPDLTVGDAPPEDWPKKGSLYARNSLKVIGTH